MVLVRHPTRLVKVTAIATICLFMPLVASALESYRAFNKLADNEFRLQYLSDRITYLDEVLTMSSRMSAATGDRKWEDRYMDHVIILENTITESIRLAPESYDTNDALTTEDANNKLVTMEEEAFRLVRNGDTEAAFAILLSPEYTEQKVLYSMGVEARQTAIQQHIQTQIEAYRQRLIISGIVAGSTLVLLIPAWFLVLKALRVYLGELQTAQNKLQKMSALGNLVAGVAHEINNPVSCIVGNVRITEDYVQDLLLLLDAYQQEHSQPSEALQEDLDTIDLDYVRQDFPKLIQSMQDSGDRIAAISKSLRTFSRADTESKQQFDLTSGLESTILILRHRLKANGQRPAIEVTRDYDNIPEISCFPGQLNQVFMNILANSIDALDEYLKELTPSAIKATPPQITVGAKRDDYQITVAIADNGPGIPADLQEKIFDQSFTTKAVGKGTGLGLAIARRIVEETHGGSLAISSIVGQGTAFWIRLPLNPEAF